MRRASTAAPCRRLDVAQSFARTASRLLLLLQCRLRLLAGSPNHDEIQAFAPQHWAWQPLHDTPADDDDVARRRLDDVGSLTCEEISSRPWRAIRIGWEFVDVGSVSQDIRNHVQSVLMERAVAYWQQALEVHRATAPLRANRVCSVLGSSDPLICQSAVAPTCGADDVTIPDHLLNSYKVCSEWCAPGLQCTVPSDCFNTACSCDITALKEQGDAYCCSLVPTSPPCPAGCSRETVIDYGGGVGICETCETLPAGDGADYDFYALVTLKDSASCSGDTQAYASTCVQDQCDRPIFGHINFCLSKISLLDEDTDAQVSTAVHELAHALVFSSRLFRYFRNADGSPMLARDSSNPTVIDGTVAWTCNSDGSTVWGSGDRTYVDLSAGGIAESFSERGITGCPCPIGQASFSSSCIVRPSASPRTPVCVVKIKTPKVLEKVREHFNCPTLNGAELENQDTGDCVIFASHWEQRIFLTEVMSPVQTMQPTFMSAVTLALFEDSGWYRPRYEHADVLSEGVHWGYRQGCSFATETCISSGVTNFPRFWCETTDKRACNLDRTGERSCVAKTYSSELPSTIAYYSDRFIGGSLAEADYCPYYAAGITNRVCTSASSTFVVASNANFMREAFTNDSRCLESTLHADVPAGQSGTFVADSNDYTTARAACYEVVCSSDGSSYQVLISDLAGGNQFMGTCRSAGQTLSSLSHSGSITCASPSEICGIEVPRHTMGYVAALATTPTTSSTTSVSSTSASSRSRGSSKSSTTSTGTSNTMSTSSRSSSSSNTPTTSSSSSNTPTTTSTSTTTAGSTKSSRSSATSTSTQSSTTMTSRSTRSSGSTPSSPFTTTSRTTSSTVTTSLFTPSSSSSGSTATTSSTATTGKFLATSSSTSTTSSTSTDGATDSTTTTSSSGSKSASSTSSTSSSSSTTTTTTSSTATSAARVPTLGPSDLKGDSIVVSMKVEGVAYTSLTSNSTLVALFSAAVRSSVAATAGNEILPEHISVELRPGSVVAVATITPPDNNTFGDVAFTLNNETATLKETLLKAVSQVSGLDAVASGPITVSTVATAVVSTTAPQSQPLSTMDPQSKPTPSTTTTTAMPTMVVATININGIDWSKLALSSGITLNVELAVQEGLVDASNSLASFEDVTTILLPWQDQAVRVIASVKPGNSADLDALYNTLTSPYSSLSNVIEGRLSRVDGLHRVRREGTSLAVEVVGLARTAQAPTLAPTTTFVLLRHSGSSRSALPLGIQDLPVVVQLSIVGILVVGLCGR